MKRGADYGKMNLAEYGKFQIMPCVGKYFKYKTKFRMVKKLWSGELCNKSFTEL